MLKPFLFKIIIELSTKNQTFLSKDQHSIKLKESISLMPRLINKIKCSKQIKLPILNHLNMFLLKNSLWNFKVHLIRKKKFKKMHKVILSIHKLIHKLTLKILKVKQLLKLIQINLHNNKISKILEVLEKNQEKSKMEEDKNNKPQLKTSQLLKVKYTHYL